MLKLSWDSIRSNKLLRRLPKALLSPQPQLLNLSLNLSQSLQWFLLRPNQIHC